MITRITGGSKNGECGLGGNKRPGRESGLWANTKVNRRTSTQRCESLHNNGGIRREKNQHFSIILRGGKVGGSQKVDLRRMFSILVSLVSLVGHPTANEETKSNPARKQGTDNRSFAYGKQKGRKRGGIKKIPAKTTIGRREICKGQEP